MNQHQCPSCGKEFDPAETSAMPFCCERCRLIDLGRWLDEEYTVPIVASTLPDDVEDSDDVQ